MSFFLELTVQTVYMSIGQNALDMMTDKYSSSYDVRIVDQPSREHHGCSTDPGCWKVVRNWANNFETRII